MTPKATHDPTEVYFEAAEKFEIMPTPRGPVPVNPGKDVKIFKDGDQWPMDIDLFLERYGKKLDKEACDHIEKHFPGKLKGK